MATASCLGLLTSSAAAQSVIAKNSPAGTLAQALPQFSAPTARASIPVALPNARAPVALPTVGAPGQVAPQPSEPLMAQVPTQAATQAGAGTEAPVAAEAVEDGAPRGADVTKKGEEPKVSDQKPTTPNATASLVNALVKKGILTEAQAAEIIEQADDETYIGREAAKDATAKADEAAKAAKEAALAASPPGTKHVAYVPEVVKRQMREELRQEVMDQAKRENWASPGKYPEWASRIHFYGDIRARYEGIFFPDGNADASWFPNFSALNNGSPYDVGADSTTIEQYPKYNTDQDRHRYRTRVRLGLEADLGEGFSAGLRLASGNDGSPVSPNQTFGGSGGNFSKYDIWLDRAFIDFTPVEDLTLSVGRFDNPFFAPADLVWDPDLGFDGVAMRGDFEVLPDLIPWAVVGAFPIFNTALDFAANQNFKFQSDDKYLYGAQVGVAWQAQENIGFKLGTAYYDFDNVKGKFSSPCVTLDSSTPCNTDALRPSFAQKGNTYMPLRDARDDLGTTDEHLYQYYGLASDFKELVVTAQLDLGYFRPYHIIIDAEYVQNLAYDRSAIAPIAVNNIGPAFDGNPNSATYDGGGYGWFVRTTLGYPKLAEFGDWNAHIGYKWLESDAMVDAFVDSDFGLGGTNLKGYFLGGNLALSKNVTTTVKGMSANAIAGAPYAVDILQLDVNAKF